MYSRMKKALKKHEDTKHRNFIKYDNTMKDNLDDEDKAKFYYCQCNKYLFSKTILKKHKTNEHEA